MRLFGHIEKIAGRKMTLHGHKDRAGLDDWFARIPRNRHRRLVRSHLLDELRFFYQEDLADRAVGVE